MDARLRLLTRQYATTRDPIIAIKVAEELLRSGAGGDITVYEVEYENLDSFRMDEKYSHGVFLTEQEAQTKLQAAIVEKLAYYREELDEEEGKEAADKLWCHDIQKLLAKLLAESKVAEAGELFRQTFAGEYRIIPKTFAGKVE